MSDGGKRFSDFAEKNETRLDGEKMKLADIVGKEILAKGFSVSKSKHYAGEYATLQFELEAEKHVVFLSSKVIIEQLQKYENQLPYLATIVKIGKYYSLS